MTEPLLALVGPTASGKTSAALEIAEALDAEIVSVDSMLLYRGMDVGTAKPSRADQERVPHHMVDVADPDEAFSVARYQRLALDAIEEIRGRGRRVLLVGGSGLYLRAIADDLEFPGTDPALRATIEASAEELGPEEMYARLLASDPVAAARIEPSNVRRTVRALEVAAATGRPFSSFATSWDRYPEGRIRAAGIEMDRAVLDERISERVHRMVEEGIVQEVRDLIGGGAVGRITSGQAIGYAEFARFLQEECSIEDAISATVKRTRALARRQMSWFRRDPRIRWFEAEHGADSIVGDLLGYLRG